MEDQAKKLPTKQSQQLTSSSSRKIELKMPDGSGNVASFVVDNSKLAHKNKEFLMAFTHMLLTSRREAEFRNEYELPLLQEAFRRDEVTPLEAYEAFWLAYRDSYLPSSGIEYRHLWKYIEEMRLGRDRRLYSYREVLSICDKERITMNAFQIVQEIKEEEKRKNPDRDTKDILCWKRL